MAIRWPQEKHSRRSIAFGYPRETRNHATVACYMRRRNRSATDLLTRFRLWEWKCSGAIQRGALRAITRSSARHSLQVQPSPVPASRTTNLSPHRGHPNRSISMPPGLVRLQRRRRSAGVHPYAVRNRGAGGLPIVAPRPPLRPYGLRGGGAPKSSAMPEPRAGSGSERRVASRGSASSAASIWRRVWLANLIPGGPAGAAAGPGNRRHVTHGAYAVVARERLEQREREVVDAIAEDAALREPCPTPTPRSCICSPRLYAGRTT